MKPRTVEEVRDLVLAAAADGRCLEVRGGGSKAAISAPRETQLLDMTGFDRVIDYDPAELVLTVEAGARLAAVESLLAEQGQMLAFEPFDHAPLLGEGPGRATIGGVVGAGVSGSRRVFAGAVRDHLLGFEGVSGRGEAFVGGARVVKNVTGYDLPKVVAGSWGRLVVLTTVTLKVLPKPKAQASVALRGLDDRKAVTVMALAMGSQAEVAAAAHLPDAEGGPTTLLRLEGVKAALAARIDSLTRLVGGDRIDDADAAALWGAVREVSPLAAEPVLWRVNTAPSMGPGVVEALAMLGARRLYDWAGGLVWLGTSTAVDPAAVRAAADAAGGHATLIRAPERVRAAVPILHPEAPGVARLSARVKAAFDPAGVLDPDRFGR